MELRQLKYFLKVADMRSVGGAANALYLSRQAVSKAITHLEDELRTELFMRDSNGAFLTPAGIMFYDRIRNNILELEQAKEEILHYGEKYRHWVRIALSVGLLQIYEDNLLQFRASQENFVIDYWEYSEENATDLLTEHRADIVISTTQPKDSQFLSKKIAEAPIGVLMQKGHGLDQSDKIEVEDLRWIPLAAVKNGWNTQFARTHGLGVRYKGYDTYRLLALTRAGRCAFLLPKMQAPDLDDLIWLPIEGVDPWCAYRITLQTAENNILFNTAVDDLQIKVFESVWWGENV